MRRHSPSLGVTPTHPYIKYWLKKTKFYRMDMEKLYYQAPPDDNFEELQRAAKFIWRTYDDEFGYASEKVRRVESMENIRDNFMTVVAMFDVTNQRKLAELLGDQTREMVSERMRSAGHPDRYNYFRENAYQSGLDPMHL